MKSNVTLSPEEWGSKQYLLGEYYEELVQLLWEEIIGTRSEEYLLNDKCYCDVERRINSLRGELFEGKTDDDASLLVDYIERRAYVLFPNKIVNGKKQTSPRHR